MSSTTTITPPPGAIEFAEFHKPPLDSGDYTITVEQTLSAGSAITESPFGAQRKFSVFGPRFTIDPQEIIAVFPAAGSLGEHSNVLPHLMLKRSTLPWERTPDHHDKNLPWLALLLFDEEEEERAGKFEVKSLALAQLKQSSGMFPRFVPSSTPKANLPQDEPFLIEESGDHGDDKLSVLEVDKALLTDIAPARTDLKWLAHVRYRIGAANQNNEHECAVLICNRLPQPGHLSTVHLVSMEGRYRSDTNDLDMRKTGARVQLISLKSWRFTCISEKQSFKGLLLHLNHELLFTQAASRVLLDKLNQRTIPDELKQAFITSKHALENGASIADQTRWQIRDRGRRYLIAGQNNQANIYNQAGRLLFSVQVNAAQISPPAIPGALVNALAQNKHPLSQSATLEAETGHWWITGDGDRYFVSREGDLLYSYYLDPDLAGTLRLPKNDYPAAEQYLQKGSAPLRHFMRQGNRAVSWYHGPLVPGANATPDDIQLPVRSADELVRYNRDYSIFDVSYAAAWELGRLLALQNKRVSLSLFEWKRRHVQSLKAAEWELAHLPLQRTTNTLALPDTVLDWFALLEQLKGVPFNYLVPEEAMLPAESLRFLQVDPLWQECLLDGAFSLGRVSEMDFAQDGVRRSQIVGESRTPLSGFLLRSEVVAGWPGLQVDGFTFVGDSDQQYAAALDAGDPNAVKVQQLFESLGIALPEHPTIALEDPGDVDGIGRTWSIKGEQNDKSYLVVKEETDRLAVKLHLLRMDRLSKNVLLCLFEGELQAADFHLKPETLHFGVNRPDDDHLDYFKILRDLEGREHGGVAATVPLKNAGNRVILIEQLAGTIQGQAQTSFGNGFENFNSAQFGLEMVEGIEKVRFTAS